MKEQQNVYHAERDGERERERATL